MLLNTLSRMFTAQLLCLFFSQDFKGLKTMSSVVWERAAVYMVELVIGFYHGESQVPTHRLP